MSARRRVFLVRHADAGARAAWTGSDRVRPLSKRGERQSARLAERLSTAPIARLISSPYLRCMATLGPLAATLGREVEEADYLAEGRDLVAVRDQLLADALAIRPGEDLAACSHGDIIPFVIDDLIAAGASFSGERSSPKGVMFALTLEGDRVTAIERTAPPRG